MGSVLRRRIVGGEPGEASGGLGQCDLLDAMPGLREMLTSERFPDGSKRTVATLLLFVEAGILKACLNDRDQGCTAWASGASVRDCLAALESGLQGDSLQWRTSGARKGFRGGKKA